MKVNIARMVRLPILALALAPLFVACGENSPIKIGFIGPLTGRGADLGLSGLNGVTLAIEEQNRKGGINGRRIDLIAKDDHQDPAAARAAMTELAQSGIKVVIGPMTSAMAVELAPMANSSQVLLVSPTATTKALSGIDDNFIRVISDTGIYAERSAEVHRQSLGWHTAFAIYDVSNVPYTTGWLSDYTADFERRGGRVVGQATFKSGEANPRQLAQTALVSGAEGILILANSTDAALLIQHLRGIDPARSISTSEWSGTERLIELAGRAADGVVIPQFFNRQSDTPAYRGFHPTFVSRFSAEPGFASIAGYDAARVVIEGLPGATTAADLKKKLLGISRFAGLQEDVVIDAFGDSRRTTYVSVIRDGKFEIITR